MKYDAQNSERTRPLLIVELAGLPGAGKTGLTNALLQELAAHGWRCCRRQALSTGRLSRVSVATHCFLANPHLLRQGVALAAEVKPGYPGRLHQALKLTSWPERIELAVSHGYDVVVLEEGVIQNLWGLYVGGATSTNAAAEDLLRTLLGNEDVRWAFVYCDVDVETALIRIRKRNGATKRIDRANPEEQAALLRTNGPQLRELLELAAKTVEAPVLWLDARRPIADSLPELLSFTSAAFENLDRTADQGVHLTLA